MRANGTHGFTLVELVVVLAVMSLLLAMAAPGLRPLLTAQRVRAAVFDFSADLVLARSEAVKRNARVQVVPHPAGWAEGWSVTVEGMPEHLRRRDSSGNGVAFSGGPARIVFDETGRVVSPVQPVRIDVMPDGDMSSQARRCIGLDPGGRPRAAHGACA